jgi:hypothetical protein
MSAVMTEPEAPPVKIKCKIEEVFSGPFIDLVRLAPKNQVVRGLILAQTRKMPGPDCETFEQIKEWVETTCDRKAHSLPGSATHSRDGIVIEVEFSETESGRANYSVPRSGSDEFALDEDELIGMVQDAIDDGKGLDGLVDHISNVIHEDAWNRCSPSLDGYGDYDYNEHDCDDTSNSEVEFSVAQIRDRLHLFLRQRHPELLEELL